MSEPRIYICTRASELPQGLTEQNFFHSSRLFRLCIHTPRLKPYMVVVANSQGRAIAHMLALVRYRTSWFPPYIIMSCRIFGEGVYEEPNDELLALMLKELIQKLGRRMLYIEVSNLSQKMFGYKEFRTAGFFPVRWMSIHNSLHSRKPEERIGDRLLRRINNTFERGVTTREVSSETDFRDFMRLLRQHNWLKPKRYIPHDDFFRNLLNERVGRLYITRYHDHVIGCAAVAYSDMQKEQQNNAYLWYAAYRRKSFAWLHPAEITIWHAIKDTHARGYDHICFLDVGLPFRKNRFREFILRFGGKPTSTYRWFHFNIGWLNSLLSWFFRD